MGKKSGVNSSATTINRLEIIANKMLSTRLPEKGIHLFSSGTSNEEVTTLSTIRGVQPYVVTVRAGDYRMNIYDTSGVFRNHAAADYSADLKFFSNGIRNPFEIVDNGNVPTRVESGRISASYAYILIRDLRGTFFTQPRIERTTSSYLRLVK